jgi:hypothetical protein
LDAGVAAGQPCGSVRAYVKEQFMLRREDHERAYRVVLEEMDK